jgi:hypothetical protein
MEKFEKMMKEMYQAEKKFRSECGDYIRKALKDNDNKIDFGEDTIVVTDKDYGCDVEIEGVFLDTDLDDVYANADIVLVDVDKDNGNIDATRISVDDLYDITKQVKYVATNGDIEGKLEELVDEYGENGEIHIFHICSNKGITLDGSTIDKIAKEADTWYFYYNENTNDCEPLECLDGDCVKTFISTLSAYLITFGMR